MESLCQKAQELDKKLQQLQTTNDGVKITVDLLNQTVRGLYGELKDVGTRKVEVSQYVRCSTITCQVKQGRFGDLFYCHHQGHIWRMVLCHWFYVQSSVMVLNGCMS